jgi:hypothetical protein
MWFSKWYREFRGGGTQQGLNQAAARNGLPASPPVDEDDGKDAMKGPPWWIRRLSSLSS